jgi:hypothetical protein
MTDDEATVNTDKPADTIATLHTDLLAGTVSGPEAARRLGHLLDALQELLAELSSVTPVEVAAADDPTPIFDGVLAEMPGTAKPEAVTKTLEKPTERET